MNAKSQEKCAKVTGKVIKAGRPRLYNWSDSPLFFMEVESEEHGTVRSMVETSDDKESSYYRESPYSGDTVCYTCQKIKADGWTTTVTAIRDFEILSHKGKEAWEEELANKPPFELTEEESAKLYQIDIEPGSVKNVLQLVKAWFSEKAASYTVEFRSKYSGYPVSDVPEHYIEWWVKEQHVLDEVN